MPFQENTPACEEPRTSPRWVVRTRPPSRLRDSSSWGVAAPPPPPHAASSSGRLIAATQPARRERQRARKGRAECETVLAFNIVSLHSLLGGCGRGRGKGWRPHR